ncbi:hypothetical protein KDD30_18650 (plasmid) [Photobacterium sp. GJ3]|nr:hypothetical protein [Photobacterium sp. GJ3]QUJ70155.1 hypothetical protein KDD30_18650 [Photobacterium sp. GJ3]
MIVNFTLYQTNVSWSSKIHQLNDDVLMRHVQVKGQMASRDVGFSYCEASQTGEILSADERIIGQFSVVAEF